MAETDIIRNTATVIGCEPIEVFRLAHGAVNRPAGGHEAAHQAWQIEDFITTDVENFCLDVLTGRIAILPKEVKVKTRVGGLEKSPNKA